MTRVVVCCCLLILAANALAHEPSRALLTLDADGVDLVGQLELSLRDLEDAVGLDANGDANVTWGELAARETAAIRYALPRLAVRGDGSPCDLDATLRGVDTHGGAAFAVLGLVGTCSGAPTRLEIGYDLLFEIDSAHRAVVTLGRAGGTATAVIGASERSFEMPLQAVSAWLSFGRFVVEGVAHIAQGYDHLAFVVLLVLPVVLGRGRGASVATPRHAVGEIVRIVTAFTIAHSLTLGLAALGYVAVPTRWVEVAIALSVLLAAVANCIPRWPRVGVELAFAFGLVHGFGFASAVGELGRGGATWVATLAGFNVGVELGQLAVVAVLVPLLWLAGRQMVVRTTVNLALSGASAALAVVWVVQRWPAS
jgi:hypothetical protein